MIAEQFHGSYHDHWLLPQPSPLPTPSTLLLLLPTGPLEHDDDSTPPRHDRSHHSTPTPNQIRTPHLKHRLRVVAQMLDDLRRSGYRNARKPGVRVPRLHQHLCAPKHEQSARVPSPVQGISTRPQARTRPPRRGPTPRRRAWCPVERFLTLSGTGLTTYLAAHSSAACIANDLRSVAFLHSVPCSCWLYASSISGGPVTSGACPRALRPNRSDPSSDRTLEIIGSAPTSVVMTTALPESKTPLAARG